MQDQLFINIKHLVNVRNSNKVLRGEELAKYRKCIPFDRRWFDYGLW